MNKSQNLIGLLVLLSFASCTRYSYLPRQHQRFQRHEKTEITQTKTRSLADEKLSVQETEIRSDSLELLFLAIKEVEKSQPKNISEESREAGVLNKHHAQKNTYAAFFPGRGEKPPAFGMIRKKAWFNAQKHKKDPIPDDGEEEEGDFSILAAISAVLGVIAWGSIVALVVLDFFLYSDLLLVISLFAAIGALVIGLVALRTTRYDKETVTNRYMAVIGIVMGGVEILFFFFMFFLLFYFFFTVI